MEKYRDNQAKERHELRVTELINTPTKDTYFIVNNRYKNMSLKPFTWTKDSSLLILEKIQTKPFQWK